MSPKLSRKLFPVFSAFFALSLMLGACGGGDADLDDEDGIEEVEVEDGEVEEVDED